MPNDDDLCTGCYGSGWDSNREATCHCQPQPMPNEPSEWAMRVWLNALAAYSAVPCNPEFDAAAVQEAVAIIDREFKAMREAAWREGYAAGAYRVKPAWLPPTGDEITHAWMKRQARQALEEPKP